MKRKRIGVKRKKQRQRRKKTKGNEVKIEEEIKG